MDAQKVRFHLFFRMLGKSGLALLFSFFWLFCACKEKTPDEQVAKWSNALKNGPYNDTYKAVSKLEELVPKSDKAIPAIISALSHPTHDIKMKALDAIANIGPPAADAVPILFDIIKNKGKPSEYIYKGMAAKALRKIGPKAHKGVLEYASSDNASHQLFATKMIKDWKLDEATPLLKKMLFGPDHVTNEHVRKEAIEALRLMRGPYFTEYSQHLDNSSLEVKKAAWELMRSYGKAIVPFTISRLESADNDVDLKFCIEALGDPRVQSTDSAEALINVMVDRKRSRDIKRAAHRELWSNKPAVPLLIALLKSNDDEKIKWSLETFLHMGLGASEWIKNEADRIIRSIQPLTNHKNSDIAEFANAAIREFKQK